MRRTAGLLLTAIALAACSGSSDGAPPPLETEPPVTVAATTEPPATVESTEVPDTEADETTTSAPAPSDAPTTTIDEQAILAEAEAAYLEAWEVRTEVLRDPTQADAERQLRNHYSGPNLDAAINDLQLSIEGGFVSQENEAAPSFATIAEPAEFVSQAGSDSVVEIVVCEFNSDRVFEVGTAPDGGNVLVRDDPVTFLNVVSMRFQEETWKLHSGTEFEAVRDEEERCSDLS